jgi:outer membrane protein OmpA-like peptidoglycan-associated protein/tetratricopeptide (TPR) repeat protein
MLVNFSKKLLPVFLSLFLLLTLDSSGQSRMQVIEMEREADGLFRANRFHDALPILLKLDSLRPNHAAYEYPIGVCYIVADDHANALSYLERCLKTADKQPAAFHYYLGRAYHLSHMLDKAIFYYTLYQSQFRGKKSKHSQQLINEVDRDIQMCLNGQELMAHPLEIEIINLGPEINTAYPEYAPVVSADQNEIIFTSNRPNTMGGGIDETDGLYYEDVYISSKKNGVWSAPVQMSTNINTDNHDASIALSPDGQTLLIYRFEQSSSYTKSSGDLYTSRLEGKTWGKAEKLPDNINSNYWEPSASITEDGKTIFFTSNKPGGKGGTDIYYSRRLPDGSWDKAINIGATINTPYDEDCPFIHPDGKTLYFSSKGHNSMGGFDIFVSRLDPETNTWGKPENFGYPISTAHDDLHFVITADARRVYFSTTRDEGYGHKDIYYADIKEKEAAKMLLITGVVTDSLTGNPVEVKIRVSDNQTLEELGLYVSNSSSGKYIIVLNEGRNYDLFFNSPQYGSHYRNIDLTTLDDYEEVELDIQVHSQDRPVKLQLVDTETQNELAASIKLTNLDAKTEIVLEEGSHKNGIYETQLKEGNIYNVEINKVGYVFYNNKMLVPTLSKTSLDSVPTFDLRLQPVKVGTSLILKNIYFATDEAKPLASSQEELNKIASFLKENPGTIIEIAAHTDDVGDPAYNLKLSERRAQEVVNYLIVHGVPTAQLKSRGYGMSKPVADGTSEYDRQQNRRVELKILKTQ